MHQYSIAKANAILAVVSKICGKLLHLLGRMVQKLVTAQEAGIQRLVFVFIPASLFL